MLGRYAAVPRVEEMAFPAVDGWEGTAVWAVSEVGAGVIAGLGPQLMGVLEKDPFAFREA